MREAAWSWPEEARPGAGPAAGSGEEPEGRQVTGQASGPEGGGLSQGSGPGRDLEG